MESDSESNLLARLPFDIPQTFSLLRKQHTATEAKTSHPSSRASPPPSPPTSKFYSERSKTVAQLTHVEEPFEFKSGNGTSPLIPMMAGAIAGSMEHFCMYPVDTVKTRMQTLLPGQPVYNGVIQAFHSITAVEGIPRLYRGASAVVLAALPSHAIYFATYEGAKEYFGGNAPGHHPVAHAISGACATAAHDACVTPVDVVKQRLQMYGSQYRGVYQTVQTILQKEGAGTFYASYPTTLVMNVPFISAHFVTYEFLKKTLPDILEPNRHHTTDQDLDDDHSPLLHTLAGAGAGALGGLVSNPFDVMKTRIQTQGLPVKMRSFRGAFNHILANEGWAGFTRGLSARMLYFTPSAAICWTTYETMKKMLGWR